MNKYAKKGSVLIMAVMVSIILMITSVGFLVITNWTTDVANEGYNNSRLYWAAESGANHALRWLKRLKVLYFTDQMGTEEAKNHFNSTAALNRFKFYSGTKDEIIVALELNYSVSSSEWQLTSTAMKDGKTSKIVLDKIKTTSIAKYGFGWSKNMENGTRFLSGDIIDGEIYAGGTLNCVVGTNRNPQFKSKVSIAKTAGVSYLKGGAQDVSGNGGFYNPSRVLGWLLNEDTPKPGNFSIGIQLSRFGYYTEPTTDSQFKGMMDRTFQQGIEFVDFINPQHGVCYAWKDLSNSDNTIKELKRYVLGASGSDTEGIFDNQGEKIKIKFIGNKAEISKKWWYAGSGWFGIGKEWRYESKDTIEIGSGSGQYNTILIPACSSVDSDHRSGYSYVEIEGNLSASAAVVTEKNDIVITGDIKYSNINYAQSEDDIQKEIKRETDTPKFSILAGIGYETETKQYKGDILVNPGYMATAPIVTSATFFTPEGLFGGFGIQSSPEYRFGSSDKLKYNVIIRNYGSLIMARKGYWHMSSTGGEITPEFYDDPRYKDFQVKPLVYIPSVGNDIVQKSINIINGGYTWTIGY